MTTTGKLKNNLFLLLSDKERKQGKRITQIELARAVDVSEQLIGRWMKNQVNKFEGEVIEKLCAYFECEVGDLLYIERDGKTSS
jgi:DNA-binding Xre family transcriptional regulator